jgi:RNA polymerase sigma factor (sigma-70 family)
LKNDLKVKHISKDQMTRILCKRLKKNEGEEKKEIQEQLLKLHSGLIRNMAYKSASGTFCAEEDMKDAKGEALLSILSLFETYDPDGPTAFSTYAYVSLIGKMKNWKKRNLLIPLPNSADPQWVAANSGNDKYINPKTGTEEEVLFSIKAMVNGVFSLDFPSEEQKRIAENIRSDNDDIRDFLDNKSLDAALASLPDKEAMIVASYFLDNKSYKQIARELGCTHQCIGQYMIKAKTKLRDYYQQNA